MRGLKLSALGRGSVDLSRTCTVVVGTYVSMGGRRVLLTLGMPTSRASGPLARNSRRIINVTVSSD